MFSKNFRRDMIVMCAGIVVGRVVMSSFISRRCKQYIVAVENFEAILQTAVVDAELHWIVYGEHELRRLFEKKGVTCSKVMLDSFGRMYRRAIINLETAQAACALNDARHKMGVEPSLPEDEFRTRITSAIEKDCLSLIMLDFDIMSLYDDFSPV